MEYYTARFGEERIRAMFPNLTRVGREEGIDFSYGGHIGNTFDSHRLIWKAREEGGSDLQDQVVESLFKAYFEEEKSMGDWSVLRECAERAGMKTAGSVLSEEGGGDVGRAEVEGEMREYRVGYRATGVPLFVVDGKYALSGAQPPEAFLELFARLR